MYIHIMWCAPGAVRDARRRARHAAIWRQQQNLVKQTKTIDEHKSHIITILLNCVVINIRVLRKHNTT